VRGFRARGLHGCRRDRSAALDHADIDARDAGLVLAGTDDLGAEFGFQFEIAADMIGMMMGVEDVGKRQPARRQSALDGFGFRRIDDGANALADVIGKPGIIVSQAGYGLDLKAGHGGCFLEA